MGKIFPHRRRKARLSPPTWPPQPVENDVELRERIAKERETRRRLADHRSRRMAERREKRERLAASWAATRSVLDLAERLAQDVFPWPLIVHECRLFDTIVKAPSVSTPRSFSLQRRGLLWSIHVVFGEYAFGALQKFHPSAAEIDLNVWRLIADLCPITADRQKLAKIAEFFEASIATIHPEWSNQKAFRQASTLVANVSHDWLAAQIEAGRAEHDGVRLIELGDGWFRIEDEALLPLWKQVVARRAKADRTWSAPDETYAAETQNRRIAP
jgi:hypothetical protein